jgi:PAS domain S-box-containing protein
LAVSVAYVIKRYGLMAITPGMAATKIIETMNESLVVLDCQGNISFVNAATQALFGRSEAELAGRPLQDVSSPLLQLFDELKGKDSLKEYEVQISDQSGQAVQVSVNASIMRGRGGEATGAVLVLRDISEFKKQMVIIEEQRQRLTTILQSIGDGVFVVDASRKIVLTNRRALHLAGEEEDGDMVGRPFIEVFRFVTGRSQEKADDFLTDALTGQAVTYAPLKTDLIRKDGERLPVAVSAAPLLGANGVLGGVAVIRDERREREVEELKNEFVSITSHQLRTPLTAIRWLVEDLLGDGSGNLTPEQKESLNNTLLSDLRMLALIKDLLNVSRLESGRVAVIPAVKDIDQLCAEAIAEVQPLAAAKQIEMKNQANGLGTLNIDARLVFQALANLLNNAIKYSQSGGTVIVSGARREDGVLIAIKDNGLGIPKRQQSLIFRKFFRADNAATSDAEGNGLGLFVAKSIIESSGGRIWFESVEDQGSTFYVSLPLAGSRAQPGDRGLEKSNF